MEKFNQNLEQFLTNISKITKKNISDYYNFTNPGDKYVLEFYKNCKEFGNDIANNDDIIFSEENTILESIDFYTMWNSDSLSKENKDIIWSYLQTLFIFAYEYVKEVDIKNVLNEFKNLSLEDDNIDIDTKNLLNIVNNLTNKYKERSDSNVEESKTDDSDNMSFNIPDIFNGSIGNLAKEIAEELDPSMINLDDPSALLKDLLSGNFDQENDETGIVNLVKNITGKIQDKISNGDINQNDLFSEAQNVMSNFSNSGDSDMAGLGSIFSNLMSNMNTSQSGAAKSHFEKSVTTAETKNRLKNKLADRKRLLKEQEIILEEELNNIEKTQMNMDLRDIDDIVNDIEGINVTSSSVKKKKKKKRDKNV